MCFKLTSGTPNDQIIDARARWQFGVKSKQLALSTHPPERPRRGPSLDRAIELAKIRAFLQEYAMRGGSDPRRDRDHSALRGLLGPAGDDDRRGSRKAFALVPGTREGSKSRPSG